MNIVMMGVQGSGKGTQSKLLAEKLHLPHVSTGDLFRDNLGRGTELGKRAKEFMDKGELVTDELVCDMVADRLSQPDAAGGCILDGFPRSSFQLAALETMKPVEHAVLLELDDEMALARLGGRSECGKCQIIYGANRPPKAAGTCDECGGPLKVRGDDQDTEAIRKRIEMYHKEIDALVRFYDGKGVLHRVSAAGTVEEIQAAVLAVLGR
ncbi:MAG TPA: nucleoside monophosphate kinase [Phycisphaerae bacterium]|nr:nucleoside monophosphate kinase [Phycisphaerae bacterium]